MYKTLGAPLVSLILSSIAVTISLLSYYRNSDYKLRRQSMRRLGIQLIFLWNQIETLTAILKTEEPVDGCLIYKSMQRRCQSVLDALDGCIELGLLDLFLRGQDHAIVYFDAFISGLNEIGTRQITEIENPRDWHKSNVLFGAIRTLKVCLDFGHDAIPSSSKKKMQILVNDLNSQAITYLQPTNEEA